MAGAAAKLVGPERAEAAHNAGADQTVMHVQADDTTTSPTLVTVATGGPAFQVTNTTVAEIAHGVVGIAAGEFAAGVTGTTTHATRGTGVWGAAGTGVLGTARM